MLGLLKKETYYWIDTLSASLLSAVITTVALYFFTGNNFIIIIGPSYLGSYILGSPRHDYYTGWDMFVASSPLNKEDLAKSKYILFSIVIVLSIIFFAGIHLATDLLVSQFMKTYSSNILALCTISFSINFVSAAINFPGNYYLDPRKASIIHSISYIVLGAINAVALWIFEKNFKNFEYKIFYYYIIGTIVLSLGIYIISWFITKKIVINKEY